MVNTNQHENPSAGAPVRGNQDSGNSSFWALKQPFYRSFLEWPLVIGALGSLWTEPFVSIGGVLRVDLLPARRGSKYGFSGGNWQFPKQTVACSRQFCNFLRDPTETFSNKCAGDFGLLFSCFMYNKKLYLFIFAIKFM